MGKHKVVEAVFLESVYTKREEGWAHVSYEWELALLDLIKKGDVEGVRKKSLEIFKTHIHNAHLSTNTLRACSNCGFLRSINRKNPDFRALFEPAR
jgi:hypothetical protein